MGLLDVDDLVGMGINAAEDKLTGESDEQEKTTFLGGLLRFIVTLIWLFIALVATGVAFYFTVIGETSMFASELNLDVKRARALSVIGIGILVVFFIITMCIPYLRKKGTMTRYLGITMLGDAIWWTYMLFSI